MTVPLLEQFAGFPLIRLVFAPVGTRLPRTAEEALDPAFQPFLVEDHEDNRIRVGDWPDWWRAPRFRVMSLVLDVGMGDTVGRVVLPQFRLEQHPDGGMAMFMVSPAMYRRWTQRGSEMVYASDEGLRAAAVTARRAGMRPSDILDEVSEAIREEGLAERREVVVKRLRDVLVKELGGVLRGNLVQEVAEKVAAEAERLAVEGSLTGSGFQLSAATLAKMTTVRGGSR